MFKHMVSTNQFLEVLILLEWDLANPRSTLEQALDSSGESEKINLSNYFAPLLSGLSEGIFSIPWIGDVHIGEDYCLKYFISMDISLRKEVLIVASKMLFGISFLWSIFTGCFSQCLPFKWYGRILIREQRPSYSYRKANVFPQLAHYVFDWMCMLIV